MPTAPSEGLEYRRAEAKKRGIPTYIEMQGNIGVIADGAGSGMLTLDLVSEYGGKTRVYSEMGGEITPELMENTLAMIAQVEGVKRCPDQSHRRLESHGRNGDWNLQLFRQATRT